jgi:transposase
MTYSVDLRKQVLLVKEQENLTFSEVSNRFGVGVASVVRWSKKVEFERTRNKLPTKIDWEKLAKDVEEHPDDYQYERAERFGVSKQGIGYALKRLNISCKKKHLHTQKQMRKLNKNLKYK